MGFPISLEDPEYDRNRFTFNLCFVLDEATPAGPWEVLVRKTARFLESVEREDCVLQIEEDLKGLKLAGEEGYPEREVGIIYYLLERILEDLNQYGECCVQVLERGGSTLNLRFEEEEDKKEKVKVQTWDVPVLVRGLPEKEEWTWDLTLERVRGYIDGVRHVARIAEMADVEVKLVKRCVRELVLLRRAVVLDIFHFGAIYTCTKDFVSFVRDTEMQDECRAYVTLPPAEDSEEPRTPPTRETLIDLYISLQPGISLRDFCLAHASDLTHIDIRRLITFGLLKNFLRRIHKFALATTPSSEPSPDKKRSGGSSSRLSGEDEAIKQMDRQWRKAALSSGWATPPSGPPPTLMSTSFGGSRRTEEEERRERLGWYLDGRQPMDRVCVEMGLSLKQVRERFGKGVVVFDK